MNDITKNYDAFLKDLLELLSELPSELSEEDYDTCYHALLHRHDAHERFVSYYEKDEQRKCYVKLSEEKRERNLLHRKLDKIMRALKIGNDILT